MKYMGSKRYMLKNGLAELIRKQAPKFDRVVDPFCGSGAITWFVAQNTDRPVLGADLQKYAVVLSNSVVERTKSLNAQQIIDKWLVKSKKQIEQDVLWAEVSELESNSPSVSAYVSRARQLCKKNNKIGPIWTAYGGHYYSPKQALAFDYLIKNLPQKKSEQTLCLASLISTASRCAASPGHTAQPFQPTKKAQKFLINSWHADPFAVCEKVFLNLNTKYAQTKGTGVVSDALKLIPKKISDSDLVIVDPPYSGVQYSRFYHVLETIARGKCGPVLGAGRYPSLDERPQSKFSNISQAKLALANLFSSLAAVKASVIFTFPVKQCSNGLSGNLIKSYAEDWFHIEEERIHGHFSTLGGNNVQRAYRQKSEELLLFLKPRTK